MTRSDPHGELLEGLCDAYSNSIQSAAVWLSRFIGQPDERKAMRGVRKRAEMDTAYLYPWLSNARRAEIISDFEDRVKCKALVLAVDGGFGPPMGTA